MTLQFTNTLGRQREPFIPTVPGQVSMYSCGPTVYRHVHVGNLRTFLLPDLVRRVLERRGLRVRHVMNITDVGHLQDDTAGVGNDRMEVAVEQEGRSAEEIAAFYTELFLRDSQAFNLLEPAVRPRASQHVETMIAMIDDLLVKGRAYAVGGDVFYDVDRDPAYGRLSGNTVAQLRAGARVDVSSAKRNPADFQLWRAAGEHRLARFASPWGEGFPGWHIECSAMSVTHLGPAIDIHTGGVDNIFPHHEDEMAQSEGALGHPVVRLWLHGELLLLSGQKMAKSAGNLLTLADLGEMGIEPLAHRYLCLTARYRAKLNFSEEALRGAARALEHLRRRLTVWSAAPGTPLDGTAAAESRRLSDAFEAALDDDLDLPVALATAHQLTQAQIPDHEKARLLKDWDSVFGLDFAQAATAASARPDELPAAAAELLTRRERARADHDWNEADRLRAQLLEMGVEVTDDTGGTTWRRSGDR